ncbi:MAG: hypothetical protein Q4P15_06465 [Propionibacteriaceae bacterium]|nr:hypothetical protein [Propionibacteriaceae bacterium]
MEHHRRTLLIWGIGALVAALLIVSGAFFASRLTAKDPNGPVPSPSSSPSPSASPSETVVPTVGGADLITVADADKIVPGASWAIANTAVTREEAERRVTCLSTLVSESNPTDTFQRSMGSSEDDLLAALHQVDLFANEGAARQVQTERADALASCDEAPAHIRSSTTVTNLGDEAIQITVALQEEATTFHTVLLVRTGRALTMLDVTRTGSAVEVDGAVAALERSLGDICTRADGVCPAEPTVTVAAPPPVDPAGWLITADLPRLRAGYGRWVVTEPADITSQGMGCENMTLATEPGPTSRQQRTYLLTQDDAMPETFGMDEMTFNFADNVSARLFTTKLINSLLSCKDRLLTAEITDRAAINGTGANGVAVSSRLITIDQAISDDTSVRYQLVVSIADTRVSYLLASVTSSYQFSNVAMQELALRTAQRNSQG